jgi:hypothetical protein
MKVRITMYNDAGPLDTAVCDETAAQEVLLGIIDGLASVEIGDMFKVEALEDEDEPPGASPRSGQR